MLKWGSRVKKIFWIGGILVLLGVIVSRNISPFANDCVKIVDDKNWSFRSFENTCGYAINVKFCHKYGLGELGQLFGMDTGKWQCQDHYAPSGSQFATIKWSHEYSSAASVMMSSSRYWYAACKYDYKVEFADEDQYKCEK